MDLSNTTEVGFAFKKRNFIFRKVAIGSKEHSSLEMKHLIRDGKMQVYRHYFHAAFRINAISSSYFIIIKEQKYLYPKKMSFRKKGTKFLNASTSFRKNLKQKKYKLKDLEEVIAEYNAYENVN